MKKKITLIAVTCLSLGLLSACGAANEATAEAVNPNGTVQQTETVDAAALVRDIPTVQSFTEEAVSEEDIQYILEAGVQSPSAMNQQPWHFSVVTDTSVLQQIASDMGGGMPGAGIPTGAGTPPEGVGTPPEGAEIPIPPEGADMPDFENGAPGDGSSAAAKAGIADAPLVIIVSAKEGSDFDAGIACQNMSVEAQLLGYGTKIISSPTMALNGANQAEYKELLGIPEDQSAVAVLLIGYENTSASVDAASSATTRNPIDDIVTYIR